MPEDPILKALEELVERIIADQINRLQRRPTGKWYNNITVTILLMRDILATFQFFPRCFAEGTVVKPYQTIFYQNDGWMHEYDDEGFSRRQPGSRQKIPRRPLYAMGPYHQLCADGHEKLSAQALQMGGVGLPIYGWRDTWSGYMQRLQVLPNCRDGVTMGHVYLDLIEQLGGLLILLQ